LTTQQCRRQKPRCVGDSWLFIVTSSVVVTRIYVEDLPRVTMSRNRLGLSLSKRITHGLIAKNNGKRKPRTCEALGQILVDHSRTRRAPAPSPTRRASVHVCFSLSPLLHTLSSAKRATYYLSRLPSTSTSNVELKSYPPPPYMNGPLRFIRNY
jgi:hypothetical protein